MNDLEHLILLVLIISVYIVGIIVWIVSYIVDNVKEERRPKCETCKYRSNCKEVDHKEYCDKQGINVEKLTFCNVRRAPCLKTKNCQLDTYCCEYYEKKEEK